MTPDPMALTADARPHGDRRCTATAKSTGSRCGQPAIPGATVCRFHGGRAPQVAAAAARRVQMAGAERALAALVPADAPPVADVVAELARLAGQVVAARDAAASMVAEVERLADPVSGALVPEVVLWASLLDKSSRLLSDMARLGLDARRETLDAAALAMMSSTIRFAMSWAAEQMRLGSAPEAVENGWRPVVGAELRRLGALAEGGER